jgi:hypothetical protein
MLAWQSRGVYPISGATNTAESDHYDHPDNIASRPATETLVGMQRGFLRRQVCGFDRLERSASLARRRAHPQRIGGVATA